MLTKHWVLSDSPFDTVSHTLQRQLVDLVGGGVGCGVVEGVGEGWVLSHLPFDTVAHTLQRQLVDLVGGGVEHDVGYGQQRPFSRI